jgi:hypothetical protein
MAAPAATDVRRALFERLIDHAALFPPANMSVENALAEDARLRSSADSWIVGRFVVPASRIAELGGAELRLTVVLDRPLPRDSRIEAVEARPGADLETLPGLAGEVYAEVPLESRENASAALERLAGLGLRAKFRCGGAAVPSAEALAAAIARCRELGLVFKATAGLHHALPTRAEHGFLNLLAAAVFGEEEAALGARDASVTQDGFTWGDRVAAAEDVAAVRRTLFAGFGSCSVAEPIADLRALGILAA